MAGHRLLIKASAAKELEALPRRDRQRTIARIRALASDPRPVGCETLTGHDLHRIRHGNYRVLYSVDDINQLFTIIKIGHRKDVNRQSCPTNALVHTRPARVRLEVRVEPSAGPRVKRLVRLPFQFEGKEILRQL